MKPPTKDAVAEALSVLMGSVNKENDSQFVFQEIPAVLASLSSLPDNVEALTIAKSCIDKELDKLIASMQHRRNLAAPIHKLPIEVLVMIFTHFAVDSSLTDDHGLLELTTVNKLWYDAIVHSPQLWTSLESWFSPKIAKLVVQRSKNLPLSLIWDGTGYDESEQPELAEVLELAVQNSARLKSIEMTVPDGSQPSVRKLLESNMPCLERLEVEAVFDPEAAGELMEDFELSDGPPLREISLNRTHLSSWSSPRLSGLVSLDFTSPRHPPSTEELSIILSKCPQLERLHMRHWHHIGLSTGNRLSDRPIILPHLKDLYADDIGLPYFVALLTSVYTPSTRSVMINTNRSGSTANPFEEVCTPGNNQLAALLGLADPVSQSPSNTTRIKISVESFRLRIDRYGNNEDRKISILFPDECSAEVVGLLGKFFLALPQPPGMELSIYTASSWTHGTLDLLVWSRTLHKLSVYGTVVCRAVLKQLAQQTADLTTCVTSWVCPNLTSIELCYVHEGGEVAELDGDALEALVRARWSDKSAVEKLSEFTIRCEDANFPSIWSRETLLKEAIPCLSLVSID